MQVVFFAQLLLVTGLQVAVQTRSPVEKVVELIQELKAKIDVDGANEQKIYDKFACWCETTTKRKADNIDAGKATIGTTTTSILELKGGRVASPFSSTRSLFLRSALLRTTRP